MGLMAVCGETPEARRAVLAGALGVHHGYLTGPVSLTSTSQMPFNADNPEGGHTVVRSATASHAHHRVRDRRAADASKREESLL